MAIFTATGAFLIKTGIGCYSKYKVSKKIVKNFTMEDKKNIVFNNIGNNPSDASSPIIDASKKIDDILDWFI